MKTPSLNDKRWATIRLERFVPTLYNSKVSDSVEGRLELC
jgi:hypothetical protein